MYSIVLKHKTLTHVREAAKKYIFLMAVPSRGGGRERERQHPVRDGVPPVELVWRQVGRW